MTFWATETRTTSVIVMGIEREIGRVEYVECRELRNICAKRLCYLNCGVGHWMEYHVDLTIEAGWWYKYW